MSDDVSDLTRPQVAERLAEAEVELSRLERFEDLTRPQQRRGEQLVAEVDDLCARLAELDRSDRLAKVRGAADGAGGLRVERGSAQPYDRDEDPAPVRSGVFGEARRAIDGAARSGLLPDHAAQRATTLVDSGPAPSRSLAARWATVTGDPAYAGAFAKLCADPERGHLLWTGPEAAAYRAVAAHQSELRAMSLTDAAGGHMVPLSLDPSICWPATAASARCGASPGWCRPSRTSGTA